VKRADASLLSSRRKREKSASRSMLLGSDLWWDFTICSGLERSPQIVTSKVCTGAFKSLYQARLPTVAFPKKWEGVEGGREFVVFEAEKGEVCEEEYAVRVRPVVRLLGLLVFGKVTSNRHAQGWYQSVQKVELGTSADSSVS